MAEKNKQWNTLQGHSKQSKISSDWQYIANVLAEKNKQWNTLQGHKQKFSLSDNKQLIFWLKKNMQWNTLPIN